ncbi:hypothetical protein [Streptomyces sp. NPDC006335]|uniref:hypothetical protein n=1 Tax=Streptomyces sp. NPDC006335 TaxID=3156895 RepID=UPI0033A366E5
MDIRITPFHGPARADAHIKLDLGTHFPTPHPAQSQTAPHRRAARAVRRTRALRKLLAATVAQAQSYAQNPGAGQHPLHIAIGYAGEGELAGLTAHLLTRRFDAAVTKSTSATPTRSGAPTTGSPPDGPPSRPDEGRAHCTACSCTGRGTPPGADHG